jgi:hypothetical protein
MHAAELSVRAVEARLRAVEASVRAVEAPMCTAQSFVRASEPVVRASQPLMYASESLVRARSPTSVNLALAKSMWKTGEEGRGAGVRDSVLSPDPALRGAPGPAVVTIVAPHQLRAEYHAIDPGQHPALAAERSLKPGPILWAAALVVTVSGGRHVCLSLPTGLLTFRA